MNTRPVHLFSVKSKEDGKRYLFTLTGAVLNLKELRRCWTFSEDFDLRTIRWIDKWERVSNYTGAASVTPLYDSNDNYIVEQD